MLIIAYSCLEEKVDELSEENIILSKAPEFIEIGRTPEKIIDNLKGINKYEELLEFIENRGITNNRLARKLDFNTFELIEDIWTKNNLRVNLKYIVCKNEIVYGKVESIDSNHVEIHGEYEFTNDAYFIEDYVEKHNEIYSANKTSSDFYEEVIRERNTLEVACGYDGKNYGENEIQLFESIEKQNIEYVTNLLKSLNIEKQALGVIGIERLIEKGILIDERLEQISNHVKTKNSTIFGCITCVGGHHKLNNYLNSIDWSQVSEFGG